MSFLALKVAWFILQPSSLLFLLFALGFILIWRGFPARRSAHCVRGGAPLRLSRPGAGGQLADAPARTALSGRNPRPPDQPPAGIIVLGGAIDTMVSADRNGPALNEAAERMTEAVLLARRYPQAKLVFTGGQTEIFYSGVTEASAALKFFTDFGIDPARMIFEDKSRTTYENATYTRDLTTPQAGQRWLLVTSAFHMSRAMGLLPGAGLRRHALAGGLPHARPKGLAQVFPASVRGIAPGRSGRQGVDQLIFAPDFRAEQPVCRFCHKCWARRRTMPRIESRISAGSPEFLANKAAMTALIADLAAKRAEAALGGPERARERHVGSRQASPARAGVAAARSGLALS